MQSITTDNSPYFHWQWNLEDDQVSLSSSLSDFLGTAAKISFSDFANSISKEGQLILKQLKENKVTEHHIFAYNKADETLLLQHHFIKTDHIFIAWCVNMTTEVQLKSRMSLLQNDLDRSKNLLAILQDAQKSIFSRGEINETFDQLLSYLLDITDSDDGFIGSIFYNESYPTLKVYSSTSNLWKDQRSNLYKGDDSDGLKLSSIDSIFAHVLTHKTTLLVNNHQSDLIKLSAETSTEVNGFVAFPVFNLNKVIGIICIAKQTAYPSNISNFLNPLIQTFSVTLQSLQLSNQQKVYEEELLTAKKTIENALNAKNHFLKNVSHELRTPLALILGPVSSLLDQPFGDLKETKMREYLKVVKKNSKHLLSMVDRIIDLASDNNDIMKVDIQSVNLHLFVKDIYSIYQSEAEKRNQQYQLNFLASRNLVVNLDSNKVEKILRNLISNAIKYTSEYGAISLTVKIWESNIKIEVKDTGTGIKAEELNTIFELSLEPESENTLDVDTSLGIGLPLSLKLAKIMEGDLQVQSSYGMGSSFLLSLPLDSIADEQSVKTESNTKQQEEVTGIADESNDESSEGVSILVVEDNDEMREYLAQILTNFFSIETAANGQEALNIIRKAPKRFDLLITDLMMPIMGGMELLKEIKEDSSIPAIPVIILTALSEEQSKLKVVTIGIDDYLMKPFIPDELLASIQNILSNIESKKGIHEELGLQSAVMTAEDIEWLNQLREVINNEIDNSNLTINYLSKKLYLSERQLYRQVQRITGMTPLKFIQEVRLQTARMLFETKQHNSISAVAYACGFGTVSYFSQLYFKRFGKKASSYLE